jgi:type I restriction enzyme R subunit
MDFKKATELFADPDFDGNPVQIYTPGPDDPAVPPDDGDFEHEDGAENGDDAQTWHGGNGVGSGAGTGTGFGNGGGQPRTKYVVSDVTVTVLAERVQYYGADGRLITESLTDYTRKKVHAEYATLDAFLQKWSAADQKEAILAELEEQGVLFAELADQVGKDFDPFDLVCHVAFDQPPLTRRERQEAKLFREVR